MLQEPDRYLSTTEAGELIGLSRDALEQRRSRGNGPPFVRLSPRCIRYRRRDVLAWLAARRETGRSPRSEGGEP